MDIRLTAPRILGAAVFALSLWVIHDFLQALLSACVIAIASWPMYERLRSRLPPWMGRGAPPLVFTAAMAVFVLAPMLLALAALLGEARWLLQEIATADRAGIAVPPWIQELPLLGPWAADRWRAEIAHPHGLLGWAQRAEPASLLSGVQSLGQFTLHHVLVICFAVLLLYFLYREGQRLVAGLHGRLADALGEQAPRYLGLVTRGVRACVNGMVAVALFDGLAAWMAYSAASAPRSAVWAAITGLLAAVPFLGYVAVAGLALRMAVAGQAADALACAALGSAVLLFGDKVVRPTVTRSGLELQFVWVLLGCVGGFETLGPVGLVIGPVALRVAAEMWLQRG
jgi:predicted PurR-regulated permease PerM